ncbi:MAG: hypothetical protein CNIPEHKO_03281 [Anaerolineales bacterium]|nr:hypothetical protein [Anaerolineales bacterium]
MSNSIFDQRGQRVNYQFNSAGNINFDTLRDSVQLVSELNKLKEELVKAAEAKVIDAGTATDVEYKITKVIQQVQKSDPDKKSILEYLNEAKMLIDNITAASGMVIALGQAAQFVQKMF